MGSFSFCPVKGQLCIVDGILPDGQGRLPTILQPPVFDTVCCTAPMRNPQLTCRVVLSRSSTSGPPRCPELTPSRKARKLALLPRYRPSGALPGSGRGGAWASRDSELYHLGCSEAGSSSPKSPSPRSPSNHPVRRSTDPTAGVSADVYLKLVSGSAWPVMPTPSRRSSRLAGCVSGRRHCSKQADRGPSGPPPLIGSQPTAPNASPPRWALELAATAPPPGSPGGSEDVTTRIQRRPDRQPVLTALTSRAVG